MNEEIKEKELESLTSSYQDAIEEIERLNNIINELEKVFIECDYQHLERKLKSLKEE